MTRPVIIIIIIINFIYRALFIHKVQRRVLYYGRVLGPLSLKKKKKSGAIFRVLNWEFSEITLADLRLNQSDRFATLISEISEFNLANMQCNKVPNLLQ